jgi:serine/threonine-protein kinase
MQAIDVRERIEEGLSATYEIVRELTPGGMSRVFMAEERALGRMVVIKVLTPDRVEGVSAERFTREIHLVARLQHPHIVPLFSAGAIAGLPYYTMPYIDGESLRTRLDREDRLRPSDVVPIVRDIALALQYAHSRGVIHRDIKPDNVLISGGSSCVADFGIARALTVARTGATNVQSSFGTLTGMGMTVGTPAYMSPEQATSSPDVDHRTDLYSLGCVAFELLTGQAPFKGRTPQQVIAAQVVQQPPIGRLRHSSIPQGLAQLVKSCLEKSPGDRPGDAADVIAILDAISSGGSHRAVARDDTTSVAVLPFVNMSDDKDNEFFADGISEEILNALAHIDGLRVAGGTSSFAFKGSKTDLATIGEKLNVDTILEGSVRKSGNRIRITAQLIKASDGYHIWSERFDRELTDVFAIQDEIAEAIAAKLKLTLKRDLAANALPGNVEAYEHFVKGRQLYYLPGRQMVEAIGCFKRALALDENFGLAHAGLADALSLSAYYGMVSTADVVEAAHSNAMRAIELAPDNSDARHSMALWLTLYGGDKDRAAQAWQKVISGAALRTHIQCSYAVFGLALLSRDFAKAVEEVKATIVGDPLNGFAHGMLGLLKTLAGQNEDAVPFARRGVELDPGSFWTQFTLQRALHCAGLHVEAQAQGNDVLEMSGRHPWPMAELAVDFASIGNVDGASALYEELLARSRMTRLQPSVLALSAVAARRLDDAIALCRRAVAERDIHITWSALDVWDGWQPLYAHPEWSGVRSQILSLMGAA